MKALKIIQFIVIASILFSASVSFSLDLYDDFSKPYIDKNRWKEGEFVREIREFGSGDYRLYFKTETPGPSLMTTFPYSVYNSLSFIDPSSVLSIQADVAVLKSDITGSAIAWAQLGGRFYNDGTPGGGYAGDIWAGVYLFRTSGGLDARYYILRYLNPDGSQTSAIKSGQFQTPISHGSTYTLYIEYDPDINQFVFKVGDETITVGPSDLPPRAGDPHMPFKALYTCARAYNSSQSAYISVHFDNVYKNGDIYDDFSSQIIDSNKWSTYEFVREISGGKLREKVRSSKAYTSYVNNYLQVLYPVSTNVIQARATLTEYQNPQGLWQVADLTGTFFNDGTPGSGFIGDVVGQVYIGGTGANPVAGWRVYRYTDASGTTLEILASGVFSTPVQLGETYTLYLGWNGTEFLFKFNEEEASYAPTTAINPAKIPFKRLRTIIWPTGDKKEGTICALFDDVYTDTSPICEGDFNHDGDVDGSDLAIFAADFGRTNCKSPDVLPCEGDFDRDGDVDGSDLAVFAADFGRTNCPYR